MQQLLPGITLDDVTALARSRLAGDDRVVLAVTPQKDGVARADGEPICRRRIGDGDKVAGHAVERRDDRSGARGENPRAGPRVESRRELADIGVTVVKFANGVEAWLKPTDFKNDQVLFTMYAQGGASLASCDDFLQARFATQYVGLSGVGGIKALDLDKLLAGKLASASPFIPESTHGIQGSAAPADLETALQLLYQEFNAPGDDPEALALMKRQLEAAVANRGRSPGQVFGEKIAEINTSGHCTSKPLTADQVALLDRAKMLAFYKARFSNAADFTFFMVGAFKVDQALPLLARYVGSLPSTGAKTLAVQGHRHPIPDRRPEGARSRRDASRAARR